MKDKIKEFFPIIIGMLIAIALFLGWQFYQDYKRVDITYTEFLEYVNSDSVEAIYCSEGKDTMIVSLRDGTQCKTTYPDYEEFRKEMLENGINVKKRIGVTQSGIGIVIELMILFSYIAVMWFMRAGYGRLKETDLVQKSNVKFDDVIGLDEIVEDISLYVSLIRNPKMGKEIGARSPKGLLLAGAPGTGKTLIAKAIAGEANVPFISVSGSEFVELYKGVGARRVRQVFKIARKHAPCILFIDEIDAIGLDRNSDDSDSEDTQTINQLLKEMDGFAKLEGVFVLAATNCPDKLDSALKRAGRFDRQVNVNPPGDWKIRRQMFEHYLEEYVTSPQLDIESIARSTGGFTGADIAMICNEASLVAIMKKKQQIDRECIEEAIDKKIFNGNKSKSKQHKKDREIVAYHEAGHAVAKFLCKEPISRASIASTTSGVGGAVIGEEKDVKLMTKTDIKNSVMVCYAGRVAEIVKFNEPTTGAQNDITKATELLMAYTLKYGFDDEIRALDYELLLENDLADEELINSHLQSLAIELENATLKLINSNFELVERLAMALLENETITGNRIMDILG